MEISGGHRNGRMLALMEVIRASSGGILVVNDPCDKCGSKNVFVEYGDEGELETTCVQCSMPRLVSEGLVLLKTQERGVR